MRNDVDTFGSRVTDRGAEATRTRENTLRASGCMAQDPDVAPAIELTIKARQCANHGRCTMLAKGAPEASTTDIGATEQRGR